MRLHGRDQIVGGRGFRDNLCDVASLDRQPDAVADNAMIFRQYDLQWFVHDWLPLSSAGGTVEPPIRPTAASRSLTSGAVRLGRKHGAMWCIGAYREIVVAAGQYETLGVLCRSANKKILE